MTRYRAKKGTYLDTESRTTFSRWHPQVKVDGKWCYLPDEATRTKLREADSESDATLMALVALRDLDTQEGKE